MIGPSLFPVACLAIASTLGSAGVARIEAPTFKPDPTVDMKAPPLMQVDTMPAAYFAIGDRDAMKFGADGSLEILIPSESPGKELESNWLPAIRRVK